jgi:hypothetical protein
MSVAERLATLDWPALEAGLWERGWASTPDVLTAEECSGLIRAYRDDRLFRSCVDMERHRFGVGDYKYFARPLPKLVEQLRVHAYRRPAAIANGWAEAMGSPDRFPPTLAAFLARCAKAGQTKPTPLLLHYEAGGYNCLHQDVYGAVGITKRIEEAEESIRRGPEPGEEVRDWAGLARMLLDEVLRLRPPLPSGAMRLETRNPGEDVVRTASGLLSRLQAAVRSQLPLTYLVEPGQAGATVRLTINAHDPTPRFQEEGTADEVLRKLDERIRERGRL